MCNFVDRILKKTMEIFNKMIASALNIADYQVKHTLSLLQGGATIPFISRYRKEATNGLNEVQISEIKEHYDKLCETAKRKETILKTIEEQGKLTSNLKERIESSWNSTELEDIYLPYKPKSELAAIRVATAEKINFCCHHYSTAISHSKLPKRKAAAGMICEAVTAP